MVGTAIVAIPKEDDYVWKISSDKIPHMTLLFLGDQSKNPNLQKIIDFVQHTAETSLFRFGLDVDHRGLLGPDDADVLFFNEHWSFKDISLARAYMLQNDNIKAAYDSTPQFDEWTPHLTLGFPASPAKPDQRDFPGTSFVSFDKIAVWTGDFEGPTFELKDRDPRTMMDMSMSDVVDDILSHHGVKGQKWGVRRSSGGVSRSKRGATTPPSGDATRANAAHKVVKKSGSAALSNKDLQDLVTRMNLEQQFSRLNAGQKSAGSKFATDILANVAKQQITTIASQAITKKVASTLK